MKNLIISILAAVLIYSKINWTSGAELYVFGGIAITMYIAIQSIDLLITERKERICER